MVKYKLQITAVLEKITKLQPDGGLDNENTYYYFTVMTLVHLLHLKSLIVLLLLFIFYFLFFYLFFCIFFRLNVNHVEAYQRRKCDVVRKKNF